MDKGNASISIVALGEEARDINDDSDSPPNRTTESGNHVVFISPLLAGTNHFKDHYDAGNRSVWALTGIHASISIVALIEEEARDMDEGPCVNHVVFISLLLAATACDYEITMIWTIDWLFPPVWTEKTCSYLGPLFTRP